MDIQVLGLNHKTAPIEVRERASFAAGKLDEPLRALGAYPEIRERVIISTCNRTEIYISSTEPAKGIACLRQFLSRAMGMPEQNIEQYCYVLQNKEAVEHLFKVASSLDSMVVGETQVFSQVKEAYFKARECRTAGKQLDAIFEEAIRVGKRVRTETQIGKGAVSTSTAAIELARKIFETLEDKTVLIIGAGKIGEVTVKNLYSRGVKTVIVANRTLGKAQELAKLFAGTAIHFNDILDSVAGVDIVISSTSAPHFVITQADARAVMRRRNNAPLFLIDLGVPRNIESSVNDIENVYVYNIDDLAKVCDANIKERLNEARKAEGIIRACLEPVCERYKVSGKKEKVSAP